MAERWHVSFHPAFDAEFQILPEAIQDEVVALAGAIAVAGPQLGRPRIDTLKGSKHANMKEGRFKAKGGRLARGVCLRPGAKSRALGRWGQVWSESKAVLQGLIDKADERFDEHLTYLAGLKEAKHR
jgi:hypothetical protein